MAPVPPDFVMGMNFSNEFQSNPIHPNKAVTQIAPTGWMVKTFSLSKGNIDFIRQVETNPTLRLAVGTTNADLSNFASGKVKDFINTIREFADKVVWVCVGNEPLLPAHNNQYNKLLVPAVQKLWSSLQKEGLNIPVTVPQNFEFMGNSFPPSAGAIKEELKEVISGTCEVMKTSGAPFLVNIYPFYARKNEPQYVPLDYCLWDGSVRDGNLTYTNIFDAMIDALRVALGGIGFSDLEIVIGECGWPTDGHPDATIANAHNFVQGMISHCKSGAGTPRAPGKKIRCFAFEAYDEDLKDIAPGPFERHWGVFTAGGVPKYPLKW